MKSEIFYNAIKQRRRVRFYYGLTEIVLDPYFIGIDKSGKKFIYGKTLGSMEVEKFCYERIANIKVMNNIRFSPIIPIIPFPTYVS